MENKQRICELLTALIKETRAGKQLRFLRYDDKTEAVDMCYGYGRAPKQLRLGLNTAHESGWWMVRKIVESLDVE